MPYEKKVSRANPGLIQMLIDDSGSMQDNLPGTNDAKFKYVERYTGVIMEELLRRSTDIKGDKPVVRPRYYLPVMKYGSSTEVCGNLEMNIKEAFEIFCNNGNSLGLGGHLGCTETEEAFEEAYLHLQKMVNDERFRDSFPPMLFHLTDGEAHSDAKEIAEKIKQLSTSDGNVLVVNAYIGTQTSISYAGPEDFPGYLDVSEAGSEDNIRLFEMSSVAPDSISENLRSLGIFPQFRDGARLFFDVRTKEMLKHVIQVVGSIGSRMER